MVGGGGGVGRCDVFTARAGVAGSGGLGDEGGHGRLRRSSAAVRTRSPSVPRGEPQWRQLIGVEEGAFSAHSKLMPKPSQTLQIISNLGRIDDICMAVLNISRKRNSFMDPDHVVVAR